jgi:hypothetical protein
MRIQSAVKCHCYLTQKQHTTVMQPIHYITLLLVWPHIIYIGLNGCSFLFFQLGSIADRTIVEVDSDKDNMISFEEFVQVSNMCGRMVSIVKNKF